MDAKCLPWAASLFPCRIFKWQQQVERWGGLGLKARICHDHLGSLPLPDSSDVCITSYKTVVNAGRFEGTEWSLIVLDQAEVCWRSPFWLVAAEPREVSATSPWRHSHSSVFF
jgi:hypothetical protein